jgi:hypothetical protein
MKSRSIGEQIDEQVERVFRSHNPLLPRRPAPGGRPRPNKAIEKARRDPAGLFRITSVANGR